MLLDLENALGILAAVEAIRLMVFRLAALRTFRFQIRELSIHDFFGELFCLVHNRVGDLPDFVHERLTIQLALFHGFELVFPLARHLRRRQYFDVHLTEQIKQRERFVTGDEFTFSDLVAEHVLLTDQVFDRRRTSRWSSETTFAHRFTNLVIFDSFSGRFHRRQKRRVGVSSGRSRFLFTDFNFRCHCRFAVLSCDEFVGLSSDAGFASVNFQIPRNDQDFTVRFESVFADPRDPFGDFVFGVRIKDRQEASQHQVVDFGSAFVELRGRHFSGRNDRKVIADFRGVKDAFCRANSIVGQDPLAAFLNRIVDRKVSFSGSDFGDRFLHRVDVIFRKILRIGTRISQDFVAVVACLCQLQSSASRKAMLRVAFTLQRRQIEQQRRRRFGWLFGFLDDAFFPQATCLDGFGIFDVPDAFGFLVFVVFIFLEIFTEPAACVLPSFDIEVAVDFPIRPRHKGANQ